MSEPLFYIINEYFPAKNINFEWYQRSVICIYGGSVSSSRKNLQPLCVQINSLCSVFDGGLRNFTESCKPQRCIVKCFFFQHTDK